MSYSEKKSMLCPSCKKLISSYEDRCPYCGIPNPGSRWKKSLPINFLRNPNDIIKIIVYTNIALYALTVLLNPSSLGLSMNPLTFLSPSNSSLFLFGATGTIPIDRLSWWWTLLSASYLHGGLLHIFFNMMALKQLGPFVLDEYGFNRFFILYTVTGIAGFYVSYLAGIPFTIGASASLCGLIGATLYYGKSRGGFYGNAIFRQVMGWVITLAIFGFIVPGINNWGHGGGIVSGLLLGFLLGYNENKTESTLHRTLAMGCIFLTIGILLWVVLHAAYIIFFSR